MVKVRATRDFDGEAASLRVIAVAGEHRELTQTQFNELAVAFPGVFVVDEGKASKPFVHLRGDDPVDGYEDRMLTPKGKKRAK